MFKFDIKLDYADLTMELKKSMRRSTEEAKRIIKEYTNKTKRDAKLNAQKFADTGYLMRQIASRIEDAGLAGIVQAHADYSPHVEHGHMVYKGQLFPVYDKTRLVGFRRVKETRFIPGKYFMKKAYDDNLDGFIQDMTDKPLSHFNAK